MYFERVVNTNNNNLNYEMLSKIMSSPQGQEMLRRIKSGDQNTLNQMVNNLRGQMGEEAIKNLANSPQMKNLMNDPKLNEALKKFLK